MSFNTRDKYVESKRTLSDRELSEKNLKIENESPTETPVGVEDLASPTIRYAEEPNVSGRNDGSCSPKMVNQKYLSKFFHAHQDGPVEGITAFEKTTLFRQNDTTSIYLCGLPNESASDNDGFSHWSWSKIS